MKVEEVLVGLEKLLGNWGITASDWILVSQYAYRLLGYNVKIREGHFNILVRKIKVPWKIVEGVEIHPPRGSRFREGFEKFIKETGFDFDINLATDKEFRAKEGFYVWFSLPNGKEIKVQKPIGAIKEFEKLLALSTKEGFGVERLDKDISYIKDMIQVLTKKGERKTLELFLKLLKKFEKTKAQQTISTHADKQQIRGIVASKGKVKGEVVIVDDIKDAKRLKDGNILITKMTSPTLTSLLPRIAAIVTDFGGMLSHAAILAREIGVPCIVGTQLATKIFKDDDFIEVDAEKGIARKLNP